MFKEGAEMTKRKRKIARRLPAKPDSPPPQPDFLARLKKIYKKPMGVTGADLVSSKRDRF
jgi:hypothetical protein